MEKWRTYRVVHLPDILVRDRAVTNFSTLFTVIVASLINYFYAEHETEVVVEAGHHSQSFC